MTWGRYVWTEPRRTPEELERLAEARLARRRVRRFVWILAIAFAALGLRNCAALGSQLECETPAIAAKDRRAR